ANQGFQLLGAAGADGAPIQFSDFTGDVDPIPGPPAPNDELLGRGRGLAAIEAIDEVSILLAPDEVRTGLNPQLSEAVINQCERLKDRFAVVSAVQGLADPAPIQPTADTSYGAFY